MGLFDKLINKAVDKLVNKKQDNNSYTINGNQYNNANAQNNVKQNPIVNKKRDLMPSEVKPRFDEVLKNEFSEFTIREYVPADEINPAANGLAYRSYTFVMYYEEKPVATILLTAHNRDNNIAFKGAIELSYQVGVPCINFYSHMPNERDFIIYRINKFLKR